MATALQKTRILSLYRKSLRHMLSWAIHREIFYEEAVKIRQEFENYKGMDDPNQIERVLQKGEAKFESMKHPDPYIVPYRPGGSLYARNPPFQDVTLQRDFGREGYP